MSAEIYLSDFKVIGEGQQPITIVRAIYTNNPGEGGNLAEMADLVSRQAGAYAKENFGEDVKTALPSESNGDHIPQAIRVLANAVEINWLVWGGKA